MNLLKMAGAVLFLAVFVATCMYGLTSTFEPCAARRSRLLFIGSANTELSRRMIEGARAAADDLGVELDVRLVDSRHSIQDQVALLQRLDPARYDGVALSPVDPESQLELINDLACQTKLVTLGRDCDDSKRLCHFGYSQFSAGALAARLVGDHMPRPGKVALLYATHSDAVANQDIRERLAGFRDAWQSYGEDGTGYGPAVELTLGAATPSRMSTDMATILAEPELRYIIALDPQSAECVLAAQETMPASRRAPIMAFDPNDAIFDAVQNGSVNCAVFGDPYFCGFTAIERLGMYCKADKTSIPVAGRGGYALVHQVVSKENVVEFRRRLRS
jgi:ABC-type sugar transport system substrate-binding protein